MKKIITTSIKEVNAYTIAIRNTKGLDEGEVIFMGVKKLFGFLSLFVICIVLVACGVEEKTEVQLLKEMPKAKTMTIDPSLSKMEATEMVHAAQRFLCILGYR